MSFFSAMLNDPGVFSSTRATSTAPRARLARLVGEVKKLRVGNDADEGVTHGPLTTSVAKVKEHVQNAV